MKRKQVLAIPLLAAGKSHIEIAAQIGCTRQTIENWLKNEEFLEALSTAKRQWVQEGEDKLRALRDDAIALFQEALNGRKVSGPQAKIAMAILSGFGCLPVHKTEIDISQVYTMEFPGQDTIGKEEVL